MGNKKRIARVFLALLIILLILPAAILTDAGAPFRISRQPVIFAQMRRLVMPDDTAVRNILHELLGESSYDPSNLPETINNFATLRQWVNGINYALDKDTHGVNDYWQTPAETIAALSGDCEDIAILFVSLLRAYGVPEDEAYVAVGQAGIDNWHAFVFEKCYMGLWRALDPELGNSCSLLGSQPLSYEIAYCFNDILSFHGSVAVPDDPSVVLCGSTMYPWDRGAYKIYRREMKADEEAAVTVRWLVRPVNSSFWEDIYYPWSLNIYDANGSQVSSWSGTSEGHTLTFQAKSGGVYYLEILKRDSAERYFRFSSEPEGWEPEPEAGFKPPHADTLYDAIELRKYNFPAPSVNSPSPQELLDYTLAQINQKRQELAGAPTTTSIGSMTVVVPPGVPLKLGCNISAQAHAEDMLEKQYFALWDSNGLMPSINHFLAGGLHFAGESIYFSKLKWDGPKDERYTAYLKGVLASAITALSDESAGTANASMLTSYLASAVSIGIAYDASYLFLVLDYEFEPFVVFSEEPQLQNAILTLSGTIAAGQDLLPQVNVSYFRSPQSLTPAQLNSSGMDYLALSEGYNVACFGGPDHYFRQEAFDYVDWAPTSSDPLYSEASSSSGLETRKNTLELEPSAPNERLVYTNIATAFEVQGNRFQIVLDLNKVFSAYGPGIYTVELMNVGQIIYNPYMTSSVQVMPKYSYTRYSFFLK